MRYKYLFYELDKSPQILSAIHKSQSNIPLISQIKALWNITHQYQNIIIINLNSIHLSKNGKAPVDFFQILP